MFWRIQCFLKASIFICVFLSINLSFAANDDYIIISHNSLNGSGLSNLISSIQSRGHSVGLQLISDGITCDSVRGIIKNRYFNSGIMPRFVLLVGAARYHAGREYIANAADSNFIPAYFRLNYFDDMTMYDIDYVAIDTMPLRFSAPHMWEAFPNLFIGRLPVVNNSEIQDYVDKLNAYYANTTAAPWKDDILYLIGDLDRGETMPQPGTIVAEMMEIDSNYIPASMERSQVKYSDYGADAAARHLAVASSLNSGKLLVYAMGTASDFLNMVDVLHRGVSDDFDAFTDLSNSGKMSFIIGASCDLGKSDGTYGGLRYWPDNFVLAPNRGAIAMLAGAGATGQNANWIHSQFLFQIMFDHPDWTLGQITTAAKIMARKARNANLLDTHDIYTYYGDPSLTMYRDSLSLNRNIKHIDFELDSELPRQNARYNVHSQISSDICRVARTIDPDLHMRECYCLGISGYDGKPPGGPSPRSFWDIMDVNIPIDSNTKFMTYLGNVIQHPSNMAKIVINCLLLSGHYLSDSSAQGVPKDQYGNKLAAQQRTDQINLEIPKFYAFDISSHQGDVIRKILVEYDASSGFDYGNFEGYFDEINFTPQWGLEPDVSQMDAPAWLAPCSSAVLSIIAKDPDISKGDSLTYVWSTTAGYFTNDSGHSVTYHAPSSPQWVNVDVEVRDRGAHQIFRHHPISIQEPAHPPVGCPAIYSYRNGQYQLENKILTGSLDTSRPSRVTVDYYPLEASPSPKGEPIELRLAEDGEEQTFLFKASLIAYDISSLGPKEELAITNSGDLVAIHDPISPMFAQRDNGFSVKELINARDGNSLISYDKGSVMIGYNLRNFYDDLANPAKISEEEGGGGIQDPGDKDPIHHKVHAGEPMGNILTVKTKSYRYESQLLGKVYPRVRSTLPVLVDFTPFITADNSHWFVTELSWEKSYRMDYTAFYRFRKLPQIAEIPIQSALENGTTNVTSLIRETDSTFYKLIPKKYVDLTFPSTSVLNRPNVKLVLKTVGYYEKYTGISQSTDEIDPPIDFQNYPNPFNATTKFLFTLPAASRVNLLVFNILGQKVIELTDTEYPAGRHELIWNGEDQSGHPVSSGIYFAKITVGDKSASKRIVIVK